MTINIIIVIDEKFLFSYIFQKKNSLLRKINKFFTKQSMALKATGGSLLIYYFIIILEIIKKSRNFTP